MTGGLSLVMSTTSRTLVRAVRPPRLQNVTWSAVTYVKKNKMAFFSCVTPMKGQWVFLAVNDVDLVRKKIREEKVHIVT